MHVEEFKYVPNAEIVPEIIDKFQPLFKIIDMHSHLLVNFECDDTTTDINEFKQAVMDKADSMVIKELEKAVKYIKEIEIFDTLFTNCEHIL